MAAAEQRDGAVVDRRRRLEAELERAADLLVLLGLREPGEPFQVSGPAELPAFAIRHRQSSRGATGGGPGLELGRHRVGDAAHPFLDQ